MEPSNPNLNETWKNFLPYIHTLLFSTWMMLQPSLGSLVVVTCAMFGICSLNESVVTELCYLSSAVQRYLSMFTENFFNTPLISQEDLNIQTCSANHGVENTSSYLGMHNIIIEVRKITEAKYNIVFVCAQLYWPLKSCWSYLGTLGTGQQPSRQPHLHDYRLQLTLYLRQLRNFKRYAVKKKIPTYPYIFFIYLNMDNNYG